MERLEQSIAVFRAGNYPGYHKYPSLSSEETLTGKVKAKGLCNSSILCLLFVSTNSANLKSYSHPLMRALVKPTFLTFVRGISVKSAPVKQ